MPSEIADVLFSEPSGNPHALVMFSGSLVLASVYAYYGVLHGSPSTGSLVLAIGFALSGFAESLPTDRRRTAGGLRIAAVLLLSGLLGLAVFAPEVVVGPR